MAASIRRETKGTSRSCCGDVKPKRYFRVTSYLIQTTSGKIIQQQYGYQPQEILVHMARKELQYSGGVWFCFVLFFKALFCQEGRSGTSRRSAGDPPAQAATDQDFCSLSDAWKRIVFRVKSSVQLQSSYCTVSSETRGKMKSAVAERSVMALTDVVFLGRTSGS